MADVFVRREGMSKKHEKEWFDNDAFWKDMHPFMFPEESFAYAFPQIEKVLTLTKPAGKAALDLCCGPGRHSIALAKTGYKVTGVDRTKFLLDIARARAENAKANVEWVQMGMRDFTRIDAFDIAINMFTSLGYFNNKREDVQVLGNILASLKPGGVFLIDLIGKERLARVLQPTESHVLPDGTKLIQRHEVFDDWTRMRNEWILIRKTKATSFKFHQTIYSGQELRDRMEQAGFTDVRLYGNLNGEEYGPDASRLIAVGRRASEPKV